MSVGSKKICADVLDVLQSVECDGDAVRIVQQLDRPLYNKTAKVLTALGGKWNRKSQATLFNEEAAPLIADAVTTGEYVDAKQLYQFFETPREIAEQLCDLAGVGDNMLVLEPSAGRGAIADVAKNLGANVMCCELQEKLGKELEGKGYSTMIGDFMTLEPNPPVFDAVVGNPPFTRGQDCAHVMRSFDLLEPGRTLAMVTSVGWTFRTDRKAVEFREWFDEHGVGSIDLPEGAFKSSGTMVRTKIVVATK